MPIAFELVSVVPYREDGQFGHRFTLRLALEERDNARLNWIERTDRPYVEGMEPDTWTDLFQLVHGQSRVFNGWNESQDDSGATLVTFVDPPSIREEPYARRTLQFWIVALDGNGEDWAVWQGIQQLACSDTGAIVTQTLEQTGRDHGDDGEPPYPEGFSPY
ncbi:hypothetical protein [Lysobacter silvisoli]|uniref:hypothetical protein n=1 Tax=Lysobacter silvisoli TaxID=2293254 RepID=UPI0011C03B1B|nr:hypothetical protein [Lysobacter silvisoli]